MYLVDIRMTSLWGRWHLKTPASPLFAQLLVQAQIKENIKASRYWTFCGEFTSDRLITRQKDSNAENASIWWRHHNHYASCFDTIDKTRIYTDQQNVSPRL